MDLACAEWVDGQLLCVRSCRCFIADLPHLQDSFVDKLLDLMPRLMASKPVEVIKILQTMLRQSTFLHLPLPEQVRVCATPLQKLSRFLKPFTLVSFFD